MATIHTAADWQREWFEIADATYLNTAAHAAIPRVALRSVQTSTYALQTLDEWIARVKARGHVVLEEKQLKCHIERDSNIAHLWSR